MEIEWECTVHGHYTAGIYAILYVSTWRVLGYDMYDTRTEDWKYLGRFDSAEEAMASVAS